MSLLIMVPGKAQLLASFAAAVLALIVYTGLADMAGTSASLSTPSQTSILRFDDGQRGFSALGSGGNTLASTGGGTSILDVLSVQTRLAPPGQFGDLASRLTFSSDGKILGGISANMLTLSDLSADQLWSGFVLEAGAPVTEVVFSPRGTTLAAAGADNGIRIVQASTGRLLEVLTGQRLLWIKIAFSLTQPPLAALGKGGQLVG